MNINIRTIKSEDNLVLASIIRDVFREYKIDRPGTVYTDPTTDDLFTLFNTQRSAYWVAEVDGEIVGGCGIYPTSDLPDGYAELVKFYLAKEARGKGLGLELLNRCFTSAKQLGYKTLYLESFPELDKAVHMYEKAGFKTIAGALGNSGHFACTLWMIKEL